MTEPRFEPRISLGNVLTIVALVGSLAAAWANLSGSLARQEGQLEAVIPRLSAIEERLSRAERDHDELVELNAELRALRQEKP